MDCIDHKQVGDRDGYGNTTSHEYKGTRGKLKLHRLAYCRYHNLSIDAIDGKVVMHTCDNPRCINPTHLKLGTIKENNADRVSKGRFCGVHSPMAKLTQADILFIRQHYKRHSRTWNTRTLAIKFGVCHQTISNVVSYRQYKEQGNATL